MRRRSTQKKRFSGPQLVIVTGDFHAEIAETMIAAAQVQAQELGAEIIETVRVPGSYEIPIVADRLMRRKNVDGLVVLGFIERGETMHGEIMGQVVQSALVNLQLTHGKPIGFGMIGPGATEEQAHARKQAYAAGAVHAVVRMLTTLASLS